jgi:hypothetical protein
VDGTSSVQAPFLPTLPSLPLSVCATPRTRPRVRATTHAHMRRRHTPHRAQGLISRWRDEEYEQRLANGLPDIPLHAEPEPADASSSDDEEEVAEEGNGEGKTSDAHHVSDLQHPADQAPGGHSLTSKLKKLSVVAGHKDPVSDEVEASSDVV